MDKFIYDEGQDINKGDILADKVLIATVHSSKPVLFAIHKLGPQKLFLIFEKNPGKEIKESLKLIKERHRDFVEIHEAKVDGKFDVYDIASKCVDVIDNIPKDDLIYVNITSGTKPIAIGLMFASFARAGRIKKIAYNPFDEPENIFYFPKLHFDLTKTQKELLEKIAEGRFKSPSQLAGKVKMSGSMLYKNMKDLEDIGLIDLEEGIRITDAGKVMRL